MTLPGDQPGDEQTHAFTPYGQPPPPVPSPYPPQGPPPGMPYPQAQGYPPVVQQYGQAPIGVGAMPAPFGYDPVTGLPYSDKSKLAAGLLSIFLGFFGVGRFYAGNMGLGAAQLAVNLVLTIITLGFWLLAAWIWPLIDGIVLLAGHPKDGQGRPLR